VEEILNGFETTGDERAKVGNFMVVIPAMGASGEARRLFGAGVDAAREIRSQVPSSTTESEWACAASFARQNGSGSLIVTDPSTGSWLIAVGTWFHSDGHTSGAESWLLRRYLEIDAIRLAQDLEGFFVLVFGDARTHEVVVLTDIVGSCHCFRRSFSSATVLSGSSLLLAALGDCQLDPVGCQEFLATGILYEDRTCYREVRKLGPASVFHFAAGSPTAPQRYWLAGGLKPETLRGEAAIDALWDRITSGAKRIQRLYAKPVCDLTGGYDSRTVVAAFLGAEVSCATVVSGPPDSADVLISGGLAKELGLPHLHIEPAAQISFDQVRACLALTDGEYDLVEYVRIREVHRRLSEQFEISINGSFGEVARGYWWELLFPRIGVRRPLDARKVAQRRYAAQNCDTSLFPREHRLDLVDHFAGVINRTNTGLVDFPNTFQMDYAYLMMRMQRWQGRIASSTNQIWPCFSFFMFRSVLETMLVTRSLLRWRSLLIRKMLTKFSPRLADYPLEHGFPAQPANWRNFYRFAPLVAYFGEKAIAKIGGKLALKRATGHRTSIKPRLQLWRDDQVKELLRPEGMKVSAWLDKAALENFLERSEGKDFSFDDQWGRLLSLECALRVAARARQACVT
jgi:hypothetical protein